LRCALPWIKLGHEVLELIFVIGRVHFIILGPIATVIIRRCDLDIDGRLNRWRAERRRGWTGDHGLCRRRRRLGRLLLYRLEETCYGTIFCWWPHDEYWGGEVMIAFTRLLEVAVGTLDGESTVRTHVALAISTTTYESRSEEAA
jgi:hypothetical protein